MFSSRLLLAATLALASTTAPAITLTTWTFETTAPTTAGPFNPEVGTGSALGSHASASVVYSSPAGNGSAKSFSSNYWSVGDYYQFSTSTAGWVGITLSWDQTSSATGPRDFKLAYSTDGTSFTDFATYSVPSNTSPNAWSSTGTPIAAARFSQDLSSITALNDRATVWFRLIDNSTSSANGTGTVATGGTDRVDNFSVAGVPLSVAGVPLPAGVWLLGSGLLALRRLQRHKVPGC